MYKYTIQPDQNFCFVKACHSINGNGILEAIEELQSHPMWSSEINKIIDLRNTKKYEITEDEVKQIRERDREKNKDSSGRTAFITENNLIKGVFYIMLGSKENYQIKFFSTVGDALDWVGINVV